MKLSELIKLATELKERYGDLPCEAQDGIDPSDFALVQGIEIGDMEGYQTGQKPEMKVIHIRT